jgi:hypothetical protein
MSESKDEAGILVDFARFLAERQPCLVTFNGRGFGVCSWMKVARVCRRRREDRADQRLGSGILRPRRFESGAKPSAIRLTAQRRREPRARRGIPTIDISATQL